MGDRGFEKAFLGHKSEVFLENPYFQYQMLKKSENVDEMQGSVLKDESENNVHPSQIPFTTGSPK